MDPTLNTSLKTARGYLGGLAAIAILGAIFLVNAGLPRLKGAGETPEALLRFGQAWLWTALLILAFLALVGIALNNRPAGVIIDNRNRVSLSKFQAALWTVLVLSALITVVAARVAAGLADPLAITIPGELLAAMGIAAVSLVATPALLSLKTGAAEPAPETLFLAAARTGRSPEMITTAGSVVGWRSPACAQWLDMLRGEEASNAAAPDLGKVQQFLITLVLVGVYAGALWSGFNSEAFLRAGRVSLPLLSPDFIWLMAISHAGYLAYKAAPHGGGGGDGTPRALRATPDGDGAVG